jgi:hypothetical protein
MDAHLVWVDAEPEYWPDGDPDEEELLRQNVIAMAGSDRIAPTSAMNWEPC